MTEQELSDLLAPAIEDLGLELVGIEFSPTRGNSLLRVYIDVRGGESAEQLVTVDDCERASREISALLDVNDPVAGRYTLEVSSPGIDRPLFTPAHFARYVGQDAKISVNLPVGGRRRFQGPIRSVDGKSITIEQDGAPVTLDHDNVQKARLAPDYEALGLTPKPKPSEAYKNSQKKKADKKK